MNPGSTPASGVNAGPARTFAAPAENLLFVSSFGEAPNAAREGACAPQT